jgi:hypothetical protein
MDIDFNVLDRFLVWRMHGIEYFGVRHGFAVCARLHAFHEFSSMHACPSHDQTVSVLFLLYLGPQMSILEDGTVGIGCMYIVVQV